MIVIFKLYNLKLFTTFSSVDGSVDKPPYHMYNFENVDVYLKVKLSI